MLDRLSSTLEPFAPPARSTILRLGMRTLPPGVERYRIEGGQSVTIELEPGDRVVVIDVEGGQVAELIALDESGRPDASVIGAKTTPSRAAPWVLGEGAASLRERLKNRGVDLSKAEPIRIF
jgi:aminomethyltransferase